jgi:hypothetical protein
LLNWPQLTLSETTANNFARLQYLVSGKSPWHIAAGGPNNDLNFYRGDQGDLMTLSSDASTDTFLTLRTGNTLIPRLQQRFEGGSGNSFVLDVFPDDWLGVKWNDNIVMLFDRYGCTTAMGDLNAGGNCNIVSNLYCATLTIRGGADVAEPFPMSQAEIDKGAVVIIDDAHPGQLKLSERAYDTRVAGIVSGANGVNPGIALHQEGVLEGGQNVALNGRVYVLADATSRPIKPGDLLTTSDRPGHAMKAADPQRAGGAILGKAMTSLKEGQGHVLVLVTLQ